MKPVRRRLSLLVVCLVGTLQGMPANEARVKEEVARLLKSVGGERAALVLLEERELEPKAQPGEPTTFQKIVTQSVSESGNLKVVSRDAVVAVLRAESGVQQRAALVDRNSKPARIGKQLGAEFVLVSGLKNGAATLRILRAADESEVASSSFRYEAEEPGETKRAEGDRAACGPAASFEGWACTPDGAALKRGEGPGCFCKPEAANDFLYVRFSAGASAVAVHSGRMAGMEATCREAAAKAVQNESRKILTEYLKTSGVKHPENVTAEMSGGFANRPGAQLVQCCSLNPRTGKCADRKLREVETWETCQCVAAYRFPGGKPAFDSTIETAAKKKP